MLSDDTARDKGIKFLREEGCPALADGLERLDCLDEIFEKAINTLGKKGVARLYNKLPQSLKDYVIWRLCPENDKKFGSRCQNIYERYPSLHSFDRPDRGKDFTAFYLETEGALFKYLGVEEEN